MFSILSLSLLACSTGTDVKISTVNSPPSVTLLSPGDGDSFDEGTVVYFQAKIQDSYEAAPDLEYIWATDIEGELLGGTPADVNGDIIYSTANLSIGVHLVTLTAWDSDAASSSASVQVEIIDLPEDPSIEIIHPIGNEEGVEDTPFELAVSVWDARDELDALVVDMQSDLDGLLCTVNASAEGLAACATTLSAGTHFLEFTVTNSAEYDASASAYYTVISLLDLDDDGDGFTENQGDCDDNDPTVSPSQSEVENGIDDNCDSVIDEGTNAYDDDGDGYSENTGDCNDNDVSISPAVTEVCSDGVDNNCNGSQNEENATNCTTFYRDSDSDGHGDGNLTECWCSAGGSSGDFDVTNSDDCYDGNSQARPGQSGYFSTNRGDGSFDYNCDGQESKELSQLGACDGWGSSIGDCTLDTSGWNGSIPSCGNSGNYLVDNDSCSGGCCSGSLCFCCQVGGPSYGSQTQECR